ncbi:MAG: hypothetical protein J0H18_03180 [Rhizobiales bacterium]|nr:hypothetical protein [Hyphomicrobiales bacterium]
MPIQPIETELAKEMIRCALFREALIETAIGFRRRDPKGFDIMESRLKEIPARLNVRKTLQAVAAEAGALEFDVLQQEAIGVAFESLVQALRVAAKRAQHR